jgi:chromosome segregation ATPase
MVRRVDLDSGRLLLDPEDLEASESYRQLQAHHEESLEELKRFRRGGRQALERIQQLQLQIEELQGEAAPLFSPPQPADPDPDLEREVANLRTELRAREASSAALRDRIDGLEGQLGEQSPDETLSESLAFAEDGIQERDDTIVRLQARIERLEKQLEEETAEADESAELRELRSSLKSREHEIEGLKADLEQLASIDSASATDSTQLQEQIDELQSQLQARDHNLQSLREEIERLQNESATLRPDRADDEREEDAAQLRHLLNARDQTIAGLQEQIAALEAGLETDGKQIVGDEAEEDGDLQQLRNDLRVREHTIETQQEQIEKLEADLERVERRAGRGEENEEGTPGSGLVDRGDERLSEEVGSLQRDLSVRDATILDLRKQVHAFEEELGQARESLLAEVDKLKALTSGELELKPSAELDEMDSDELLGYARDVAEDLDVRRQTLDEGLSGIESVKGSYEESKRVYQDQEKEMQDQLESLRGELESYQVEQERDKAAGGAESHELIVKQREQLDLLSTRIRQLVSSNQGLNESNKKMYENLEQAVKRVIPLRKQIEDLDSLNEALQRYIRQTHDRTFTTKKLTAV